VTKILDVDLEALSGNQEREFTAGLREVADAGAEMLLLNPVGADVAEDREQMERLAAEVVPALR